MIDPGPHRIVTTESRFHFGQQVHALVKLPQPHASPEVLHAFGGVTHHQRLVARSQKSGAVGAPPHTDIAGQREFRLSQLAGDNRPQGRVGDAPLPLAVPGVHQVLGAGMGPLLCAHAAQERNTVHLPGQ